MDDDFDTLLVAVKADTSAFKAEIEGLRGAVNSQLGEGFARAGNVLERGLLSAVRKGSLGFDDLKRVAMQTLNEIAAQALQSGICNLFGGAGGGLGGIVTGAIGALFGVPGRATGGPVAPGSAYLVGERGPELFVPTSAGRVENGLSSTHAAPRDVRVAIQLAAPRGESAPTQLRRSARQVASSVRRALL